MCAEHVWWQVLRTALPSTSRREVQEYIPAQLYHAMAGSAWLSLVSQHRQQTQALSPHQARAQFLGKSPGLGEVPLGGSLLRRGPWRVEMEAPFSVLVKLDYLKRTPFSPSHCPDSGRGLGREGWQPGRRTASMGEGSGRCGGRGERLEGQRTAASRSREDEGCRRTCS